MPASLSTRRLALAIMASTLLPGMAAASCGASFCPLNTQWEVQGQGGSGLRVDLRQEYIDQNQLRAGSRTVAIGQIPTHDGELDTLNRNTLLGVDYGAGDWGVSVTLPWVNREHRHIHHQAGTDELEQWDLEGAGDARVTGRRALGDSGWQVLGGLKLPTGDFDAVNAAGEPAERALQAGSGTTDLILGTGWHRHLPGTTLSVFAQGMWQQAIKERADFRPGAQATLDSGLRYAAGPRWSLMVQLNVLARDRDQGLQAEPDDSGGRYVFVSPGVSVQVSRNAQLYAFLQQPVYQHVNGVQLTADQAWSAGISLRL
ncbi:MAG TPA: hypothetical protein VFM34_03455 [Moraxellaceae bacterium]|nr:hypothetical protein [Moraxellaceae bacterium]